MALLQYLSAYSILLVFSVIHSNLCQDAPLKGDVETLPINDVQVNCCSGLIGDTKPEDFRLTKLLDIRLNGKYEEFRPDLESIIRSEIQESHKVNINKQKNLPDPEKYVNSSTDNINNIFREILVTLNDTNERILKWKRNVSDFVDNYVSAFSSCHSSNIVCEPTVGVQYNKVCADLHVNREWKQNITGKSLPRNCKEILENGNTLTGIYKIQPISSKTPMMVVCDMDIKGGGWTHIHKRFDGSQDFYLGWREYKFGFGNLEGEFWLGLEAIYALTRFGENELLVELEDRDGIKAHAQYKVFGIGAEAEGYPLNVLKGFSGDAGDSLNAHLGSKFTTKDFDQDTNPANCAQLFSGAWWYKSCHTVNLNGKYINLELPSAYQYQGMHWKGFRGHEYSHAKARMLVRPT